MFRSMLVALGLCSDPTTTTSSAPEELSASAIVAGTVSGSHVLTIDGYSQTKELLCTGKCATSRPFTVAGHRWVMHYFPNGVATDSADYVSVFIRLERHITDVKARIKLSLLDKDGKPASWCSCPRGGGPGQVCTFTATHQARGWGSSKFIDRSALDGSDHYLRADCFRVRCDVVVFQEMHTEDRDANNAGAIAVPAPDLGRHLGRLLSGGEGADVTFDVAGETFPAHRYILAARSPVFMAELFGSMKEKTATRVRVDDMEPRVFKALLHFVYTDSLPEVDDDGDMIVMAQHLLVAADRYGMERMRLVCEEKLRGYINATTVGTTLALAEQHGCVGLKKACVQFLTSRSNLKEAMATDGFGHLTSSCPSVLKELLNQYI